MKKIEKKGIIVSAIVAIMGLIGLIYTTIVKNSVENTDNMYVLGVVYLVLGLLFILYYIRLSKNKKKSDEQENIYMDERIKRNEDKSIAITAKIIFLASIIFNFIDTFFIRQYQEFSEILSNFVSISIIIYAIVYQFVSKKN